MHHYVITCGTREFWIYGDDVRARKVANRWIRLFWDRFVSHTEKYYPGSMANAENSGWHSTPECTIHRSGRLDSAGVIPYPYVKIESFELSAEARAEFNRIAR